MKRTMNNNTNRSNAMRKENERHQAMKRKNDFDDLLAIANSPTILIPTARGPKKNASDNLLYLNEHIFEEGDEPYDQALDAMHHPGSRNDNDYYYSQARTERSERARRQKEVENAIEIFTSEELPRRSSVVVDGNHNVDNIKSSNAGDGGNEWWQNLSSDELEKLKQLYTNSPLTRNQTHDTTFSSSAEGSGDSFGDEEEDDILIHHERKKKKCRSDRILLCTSIALSIVIFIAVGFFFAYLRSPSRNNSNNNQVANAVNDGKIDTGGAIYVGNGVSESNNDNDKNNNGETAIAIDEEETIMYVGNQNREVIPTASPIAVSNNNTKRRFV